MVIGRQAGTSRLIPQQAGPLKQRLMPKPHARSARRQDGRRLGGNTDGAQSEFPPDFDHQLSDDRVQMHVLVSVGVIEAQAGGGEGGKLGTNFGCKLTPGPRAQEIAKAEAELLGWELTGSIDEIRYLRSRQDSWPFNHHEMQPHA